jgi:uncharacterized protein (DUF433 family)
MGRWGRDWVQISLYWLGKNKYNGDVPMSPPVRRSKMTFERIEINPDVIFRKPVIKGTRITVEHLLRKLAGGMAIEEIIADHPHLTPDDIYAAAAFAADYSAQEEIIFSDGQRL